MKKTYCIFVLFLAGLLTFGLSACSSENNGSGDVFANYYNGTYSGIKLQLVINEAEQSGATATVLIKENTLHLVVKGFPGTTGELSLKTEMATINSSTTGSFSLADGTSYTYTVYFKGSAYSTEGSQCIILCTGVK